MSGYANILPILQTMAAVICLGGALLLLLRGRDSRSRRMLAAVMSIWGLIYATRVAGTLMGNSDLNFTNTDAADTLVLVAGNFFLIVLLLYPLEVVRPGWLSLKRAGMLLLPYAALSLLYYAGLYLLGQEPLLLPDTDQFMEHIGEFNVWYRLLMIVSIVLYLAFLFRLTWRYKEVYRQWCHDNYSDQKNIDISWLRRYGIGVALIGVAYFWLLFDGSTYCLIVHNLTVQCFFCYTLYKGLFQNNPYTEDFFRHTLDETDARREAELREERLSANHADSPRGRKHIPQKTARLPRRGGPLDGREKALSERGLQAYGRIGGTAAEPHLPFPRLQRRFRRQFQRRSARLPHTRSGGDARQPQGYSGRAGRRAMRLLVPFGFPPRFRTESRRPYSEPLSQTIDPGVILSPAPHPAIALSTLLFYELQI